MAIENPFGTESGVIFPPKNNPKEGGARVDFRNDIPFANQIEWHGMRLGWSRMTLCPCQSFNKVTEQIDPNCSMCNGSGYTPFQTPGYFIDPTKAGPLTESQQRLVTRNKAMVIRGLTMGMSEQPNMFAVLGKWALGSVMVTVRPENKLGYYDRLIYLDDVIPFSELLEMGSTDTLKLKYPAETINGLISETKAYNNSDVVLQDGNVKWLPGRAPPKGTRLSINYLYHPVFIVLEFVHLIRTIPFRNKKPLAKRMTPIGDTMRLPIQVVARLEHLPLEMP